MEEQKPSRMKVRWQERERERLLQSHMGGLNPHCCFNLICKDFTSALGTYTGVTVDNNSFYGVIFA